MRTRILLGTLALAGLGLSACGGGGDGGNGHNPTPGNLTVSLVSAPSAPGAVLFTVSGGAINSVAVSGTYHEYETTLSPTSRKVLLTGNIIAGALVSIAVPDINKASQYSATMSQVSARSGAVTPYQQLATAGFGLTVQ